MCILRIYIYFNICYNDHGQNMPRKGQAMKNYRISFIRMEFPKEREPIMETIEVIEFERPFGLTNRDFKGVILNTLFFHSCRNVDFKNMVAVVSVDGEVKFTVMSDTIESTYPESSIDSYVSIFRTGKPFYFYRKMNVAC